MNLQQAEKLKGLIKISTILSAQEKPEWLTLLELMDNKQMGELEKILASDKRNVGGLESRKPDVQAAVKAQQPIINSPPKAQLPNLSHLVNLPNNLNKPVSGLVQKNLQPGQLQKSAQTQTQPPLQPKPSAPVISQPIQKKNSVFAERLKTMFAEKELPPGKPPEPLELSAPALNQTVSAPKPVPPNLKPAVAMPPAVPKAPIPPKPKPAVVPILNSPQAAVEKILQAVKPLSNISPAQAVKPKLPGLNIFSEKTILPPILGAKIPNRLPLNTQEQQPAKIQKPLQTNTEPQAVMEVTLESMQDVASLGIRSLQTYDLEALVKKIKILRDHVGYFDLITNLETSPVYKAYMETGIKLLTDEISFEQLVETSSLSQYLSRSQFEKFADLLVKIQAA